MTELIKASNTIDSAHDLIKKSMYASMAAGLVPVPIFDILAVSGIQLEMLRRLSHLYGVTFMEGKGKNALAALIGGTFPMSVTPMVMSLVKSIPIVGSTVGVVSLPLISGASTYAVGKVFIQHFESGGTFLTFDPEKVRIYYAEQLKEGKTVAASSEAKKASA